MKTVIDAYEKIFKDKKRIMVVLAHPDDLELFCGGTVARLIADGKRVRSVKVTGGEMGSKQKKITSDELKALRLKEDSAAMKILGIREEDNIYLGLKDGGVENDMETIGKIVEQIRIFKPDLIISHNPEDKIIRFDSGTNWVNHRDHLACGKSTMDAIFPFSRDLLFFPEHFRNPEAESWAVAEFLLVDYYDHPDMVHVEVGPWLETRIKAHSQHLSQKYGIKEARESADFFTKLMEYPEDKRFERFRYVVAD